MEIRKLTEEVSVAGQIAAADMPTVKAAGFRSLVCNRPDGEGPGQPAYETVAAAARAEGLEAHYLPVVSGALTTENVDDFARLLPSLPKPVLAYCRSGARSTQLWSLATT